MRYAILLAPLASLLLTACGEKEEPKLSQKQAAIAAELEKAPPNSLIIFADSATVEWGIVCPTRYDGRITMGAVGFAYAWRCGSPSSLSNSMTAKEMSLLVDKVIVPSDPSYANAFKSASLEMML